MNKSKIISFVLIFLLFFSAIFFNFSSLKKSFVALNNSISLLKKTQSSVSIHISNNSSLSNLLILRDNMSLISFDKDDLSVLQKFFPVLLEKIYNLSNVSISITKQYSSLNNKKTFNCNIKFKGDYTQFIKAINSNYPLLFIDKLELNGEIYSVDFYGYVVDPSGNFVYDGSVKAYSVFEQLGIVSDSNVNTFEGSIYYKFNNNVYFLKPIAGIYTYLTGSSVIKYLQSVNPQNTYLILPIKDDLSI